MDMTCATEVAALLEKGATRKTSPNPAQADRRLTDGIILILSGRGVKSERNCLLSGLKRLKGEDRANIVKEIESQSVAENFRGER
jgi:hypothetical protein